MWTEKHGRMGLVAKGARRPKSPTRSVLVAFQPLVVSWFGRGELRTLKSAEPDGAATPLGGQGLMSAFYLNELLLKLTHRDDPHEKLFAAYDEAIGALRAISRDKAAVATIEPVLRRFELTLLQEVGYAVELAREAGRQPDADRRRARVLVRRRARAGAGGRGGAATRYGKIARSYPHRSRARPLRRCGHRRASQAAHAASHQSFAGWPGAVDARARERDENHPRPRPPFQGRGKLPMIELGVNIDHVATIRQARRTYEPDPVWAAVEAHLGGADGITVHLREDRRHIQDEDVRRLRELTHIKLNLEMAATDEMIAIACGLKPEMAMLVPEGREEVTTEGGLDIVKQENRLKDAVARLAGAGIVTSVFIDAEPAQVEAAERIGARVCEVHTGPYAHAFHQKGRDPEGKPVVAEIDKVRKAGEAIRSLGMRFNAGHALNYANVEPIAALPGIRELHIGHAIVSRAVFVGMREAVREMKALMVNARLAK